VWDGELTGSRDVGKEGGDQGVENAIFQVFFPLTDNRSPAFAVKNPFGVIISFNFRRMQIAPVGFFFIPSVCSDGESLFQKSTNVRTFGGLGKSQPPGDIMTSSPVAGGMM